MGLQVIQESVLLRNAVIILQVLLLLLILRGQNLQEIHLGRKQQLVVPLMLLRENQLLVSPLLLLDQNKTANSRKAYRSNQQDPTKVIDLIREDNRVLRRPFPPMTNQVDSRIS